VPAVLEPPVPAVLEPPVPAVLEPPVPAVLEPPVPAALVPPVPATLDPPVPPALVPPMPPVLDPPRPPVPLPLTPPGPASRSYPTRPHPDAARPIRSTQPVRDARLGTMPVDHRQMARITEGPGVRQCARSKEGCRFHSTGSRVVRGTTGDTSTSAIVSVAVTGK